MINDCSKVAVVTNLVSSVNDFKKALSHLLRDYKEVNNVDEVANNQTIKIEITMNWR